MGNHIGGQTERDKVAVPPVGGKRIVVAGDTRVEYNTVKMELSVHLVQSALQYFNRNFPTCDFVPTQDVWPVESPVYVQACMAGAHFIRRFLAKTIIHVDPEGWPLPQWPKFMSLGPVPSTLECARSIAQPDHYGFLVSHSTAIDVCSAYDANNVGFEAIIAIDYIQYYSPEELAYLIFMNGDLYCWQMSYDKVSGHLCNNEVSYVMHNEEGDLRFAYGHGVTSVGNNLSWIRTGSKHVAFSRRGHDISGMLAVTALIRCGEWRLYHVRFLEGQRWPLPVRDNDLEGMMSDSYFGRMDGLERHFVAGMPAHDLVTYPLALSNVKLYSYGSQIYCFGSGRTLWYVDKALVYSCADWIAYKPRTANSFAGIQSYARVAARQYRARPEQTHRIVGLSAMLGFSLNVEHEIAALVAMVHKNKKQLDLLNNLLAFTTHNVNPFQQLLKVFLMVFVLLIILSLGEFHLQLGEPFSWMYTGAVYGRPDVNYIAILFDRAIWFFVYLQLYWVFVAAALFIGVLWFFEPGYKWRTSTVDHLSRASMWLRAIAGAPRWRILGFFPPGAPSFDFSHSLPLRKVVVDLLQDTPLHSKAVVADLVIHHDEHPEDSHLPMPDPYASNDLLQDPVFHSEIDLASGVVASAPELHLLSQHPRLPVLTAANFRAPVADHFSTPLLAEVQGLFNRGVKNVSLVYARKTARDVFAVYREPLRPKLSFTDVMVKYNSKNYDNSLLVFPPTTDGQWDEMESFDYLVPVGCVTDAGHPIIPHVDAGTLIVAFCERMGKPRARQDDPAYLRALADHERNLSQAYFHPRERCSTAKAFLQDGIIHALSDEQWDAKFSSGKRKRHEAARVKLRAGAKVVTKSVVHIKKEVLLKGVNDDVQTFSRPRIISAKDATYDVVEAPFTGAKQIRQAEIFDETHYILFGGISSTDMGRRVASKLNRIPVGRRIIVEGQDTNDHDGSYTRKVKAAYTRHQVRLGRTPQSAAVVSETEIYRARDHNGSQMEVDSAVSSGVSATLCENTDLTAVNMVSGWDATMLDIDWEYSFVVACGDDGMSVIVLPEDDVSDIDAALKSYKQKHLDLGYTLEVEWVEGVNNLSKIQFCSARFVSVTDSTGKFTLYLMPNIGRCFAKLGWFANPMPDTLDQCYRGDLLCRAVQFAPIKMLYECFSGMYEKLRRSDEPINRHVEFALKLSSDWIPYSVALVECPETWQDLAVAYGADVRSLVEQVRDFYIANTSRASDGQIASKIYHCTALSILLEADDCASTTDWF